MMRRLSVAISSKLKFKNRCLGKPIKILLIIHLPKEEKHFIAICEDYYRIPLSDKAKIKETKPFSRSLALSNQIMLATPFITEEA